MGHNDNDDEQGRVGQREREETDKIKNKVKIKGGTTGLLQEVERAERGTETGVWERLCMRLQWREEGGSSHPLPEPLLRGCCPFLERAVRERRGGPPDPMPRPALAPSPPWPILCSDVITAAWRLAHRKTSVTGTHTDPGVYNTVSSQHAPFYKWMSVRKPAKASSIRTKK